MAHAGDELRLVLARLRQLPILILNLIEQPYVLDSDHRLVGKRGDKLDLLGRKWLGPLSCDGHDANAASLPEQWDAQHRTIVTERLGSVIVFRIGAHIRNMHHLGLKRDSSGERVSARGNGMSLCIFFQLWRQSVARRDAIDVAITKENGVLLCVA